MSNVVNLHKKIRTTYALDNFYKFPKFVPVENAWFYTSLANTFQYHELEVHKEYLPFFKVFADFELKSEYLVGFGISGTKPIVQIQREINSPPGRIVCVTFEMTKAGVIKFWEKEPYTVEELEAFLNELAQNNT